MQNLWVAIPDSSLSDEQTKRDKSVKIAQFARACSIFRVKRVYIYHDPLSQFEKEDPLLLRTVLRYLDTPQYLRKILYPKMSQLEFAGILHPIKAPHHKPAQDIKTVRAGDIRTGVIVKVKGALFVEAGLGSLVPFDGQGPEGKKLNVKFTQPYPNLRAKEATELDISEYWGYEVKEGASLVKLLAGIEKTVIVVTSRKGSYFKNVEIKLGERVKASENVLIVFGAPRYGVHEILAKEGTNTRAEFIVNMFPAQATETVRLEEAILGTLAILNSSILSKN
jgi:predicted SPOUT superfamily RNA methylase MTH1